MTCLMLYDAIHLPKDIRCMPTLPEHDGKNKCGHCSEANVYELNKQKKPPAKRGPGVSVADV